MRPWWWPGCDLAYWTVVLNPFGERAPEETAPGSLSTLRPGASCRYILSTAILHHYQWSFRMWTWAWHGMEEAYRVRSEQKWEWRRSIGLAPKKKGGRRVTWPPCVQRGNPFTARKPEVKGQGECNAMPEASKALTKAKDWCRETQRERRMSNAGHVCAWCVLKDINIVFEMFLFWNKTNTKTNLNSKQKKDGDGDTS